MADNELSQKLINDNRKKSFLSTVSGKDFEDILTSVTVISISNGIYFIGICFYIIFVLYDNKFYFGYDNIERLPIALFVDRRYNFFWVLLFINVARILLYFLYEWSADLIRYSYWVYSLHKSFNLFYIVFDIIYLLILLFLGWNCNASWFPDNPCNDPNYCSSFGNQWDTLCLTQSFTALNPNLLYSKLSFTFDFWFTFAFLLLDIIMYFNAKSFHLSIVRFIQLNYNK